MLENIQKIEEQTYEDDSDYLKSPIEKVEVTMPSPKMPSPIMSSLIPPSQNIFSYDNVDKEFDLLMKQEDLS